jgi:hypothetical protein
MNKVEESVMIYASLLIEGMIFCVDGELWQVQDMKERQHVVVVACNKMGYVRTFYFALNELVEVPTK